MSPKPLSAPLIHYKGRGATTHLPGRFEIDQRDPFDDGWSPEDIEAPPLRTEVFSEQAKSILTYNTSPDLPFNVSLNPYRGCEHGCIYCFARPTHSYLGLSPGLDFESRLYAKVNAPQLLERELAKPSYQPQPIALGINTDAYQPIERKLCITRRILEVLHTCAHPVGMITKSSLIERDLDLLAPMAECQQATVTISMTTLDAALARILEPRAAAPERRLRTVQRLAAAGIPVAVSIAPVIPFITEPELERVLAACASAGATSANYVVLRLPWEVAPLFRQWLATHFPDHAQRVMNRVQEMRGGKDYRAEFGQRMQGEGLWANLLQQRFANAVRRLGLKRCQYEHLDSSSFMRPVLKPIQQNSTAQLTLFADE